MTAAATFVLVVGVDGSGTMHVYTMCIPHVYGMRIACTQVGVDKEVAGDALYVNDPGFHRASYSHARDVVGWRLYAMARAEEAEEEEEGGGRRDAATSLDAQLHAIAATRAGVPTRAVVSGLV